MSSSMVRVASFFHAYRSSPVASTTFSITCTPARSPPAAMVA
jgi:hypothetical protein